MPLIFVNLDHRRRIILLNHPTLRLLTQTSSVFFHYCSFLNDFLFLALVVKPVIYLSQRRRKTKKIISCFQNTIKNQFFCILKTVIRNDKREDMVWQWKKERHAILKFDYFIFHGVLLCLDTFRCNYIENSWNILNIRKQIPNLTTTSTSIWCSLLFHHRFFVWTV